MGFIKEFKDFAVKGNLVDLAVAFVMGAAFVKVTTAFIQGIVMPLVGLIQGKDMSEWRFIIKGAQLDETGAETVAEVSIKYGDFIGVTLEFMIIAFFMFLIVKGITRLKKKKEEAPAAPPETTKEEVLLTEIRDLLKK
ncbi:MAG: large-conductance mechanosensitive channel protein MscL [Crocinitomicaceae bacterium]|nr:large-conductance mechanosensitive channel protein MscL [Crocinitomicaceae bacterium]